MTKRLVEIDDAKVAAVRAALGTTTLKGTVDAAFDEVLALVERRNALLALRENASQELADPEARRLAWG